MQAKRDLKKYINRKKWYKNKTLMITGSSLLTLGIAAGVATPIVLGQFGSIQDTPENEIIKPDAPSNSKMTIKSNSMLFNNTDNKLYLHKQYGGNMEFSDYPDNFTSFPTKSFHLEWDNVPTGTMSFAIVMLDLTIIDMGSEWDHWLVANLDASVKTLNDNASKIDKTLIQGINSWGENVYGGPTPPGDDHEYSVKVYALNTQLSSLTNGFFHDELEINMQNKILASAELKFWYRYMGFTYTNNFW